MKICDLHSHSCFSDGSLTPTELIALAKKQGICALALTDHNTTGGLPEFLSAARGSGVKAVPGCEFSTEFEGQELHIVALFLKKESWKEVEDYVELMHMAKHNSNLKLLNRLSEAGYVLEYEEVKALTDAREFNRNHVARALFKKGYVSSVDAAFKNLLKQGGGFYEPAKKLGSLATIRFIKQQGAAAVWAHPFFSIKDKDRIDYILSKAVEAGLDAVETDYTTYTDEETKTIKALADKYHLLYSGGSDFHGEGKPDINLGSGYGELKVPYKYYEKLKNA